MKCTRGHQFNKWCDHPAGVSLTERRSADFIATFRLRRGALRFAERLLQAEQQTRVAVQPGGGVWSVAATAVLLPSDENLTGYHAAFGCLAHRFGGTVVAPRVRSELETTQTILSFSFPKPSHSWRAARAMLKCGESIMRSRRFTLDGQWLVSVMVPQVNEQETLARCQSLHRALEAKRGQFLCGSGPYALSGCASDVG